MGVRGIKPIVRAEPAFSTFLVVAGPEPVFFDNEADAHLFARLEAEFGGTAGVFRLEDPDGLVEIATYMGRPRG